MEMRNAEGYYDPTAALAIGRVEKEDKMDDRETRDAMKRERQKVVESLRRKVFGLRGLADLMVHIRGIDEGVDIGERIGELGNTIGELTEGMLDMIDTLERDGEDE